MTSFVIDQIDSEIELLRREDPLRSWNKFFDNFNYKIISEYLKLGKYFMVARAQYTDMKLSAILSPLRESHSFVDHDFNDVTGNLILKNKITGKFEEIFIGDQVAEMIFEVCEKFQKVEMNKDGKNAKKRKEKKANN